MTREPDRFDKQGTQLGVSWGIPGEWVAAALRQAADEALQASIDACDDAIGACQGDREVEAVLECIKRIRALKSPAAAPAAAFACGADMESDGHLYRCDRGADHTGPHGERDYAEWTDETHHDAPPSEPAAPAPPVGLVETLEKVHGMGCGNIATHRIPAPPSEPAAPSLFDALDAMCNAFCDVDAPHVAACTMIRQRIAELEAALRELTRAATEHANAHGCSGDLGARLSDAKALLAARTSAARGAGEGT